jgi:hypothetical protein
MSNPYQPNPYDPYQQQQQQPGYSQPAEGYSQPAGGYSQPQYNQAQPGYGQPVYAQPMMVAQAPTNNNAVIALILGICCYVGFGILTGVPAVIFGHKALREINASGGTQSGKPLATIGLILGYVGIGATLLVCFFFALFFLGILGAAATHPNG